MNTVTLFIQSWLVSWNQAVACEYSVVNFLTVGRLDFVTGLRWTVPAPLRHSGTRFPPLYHQRVFASHRAMRTCLKPPVPLRCRKAGVSMTELAFALLCDWKRVHPQMVHDNYLTDLCTHYPHMKPGIKHTWVSLMIVFSLVVEGVGEENTEDKSYCDVAVEDVIPAVKTLIRAVRWVHQLRSVSQTFSHNLWILGWITRLHFGHFMACLTNFKALESDSY